MGRNYEVAGLKIRMHRPPAIVKDLSFSFFGSSEQYGQIELDAAEAKSSPRSP